MDSNQLTLTSFTARLWLFAPLVLVMTGTLTAIDTELSVALDSLPRSPRVGSQRIPLPSYNRVPISKLLANPTDYHLREVRIAGTVRTVETHLMTRGCGKHHELTVISLEDESGAMDVFDQGACGRNTSPVRAPMLAPGDRVDLLVQVVGEMKTDEPGASPEVIVLWIDRAKD